MTEDIQSDYLFEKRDSAVSGNVVLFCIAIPDYTCLIRGQLHLYIQAPSSGVEKLAVW